jgi:hypothetical protein
MARQRSSGVPGALPAARFRPEAGRLLNLVRDSRACPCHVPAESRSRCGDLCRRSLVEISCLDGLIGRLQAGEAELRSAAVQRGPGGVVDRVVPWSTPTVVSKSMGWAMTSD